MELNAAGATAARYTLAPFGYGDLVSQRRWGVSSFYHFDALGTTRRVTAADESTQLTYVRDAFGVGIASTGTTTNRFRYLGKLGYVQEDTLAGALLRRRYYQYEIGRFVSRDPLRDPGRSEYGYVLNAPTVGTDAGGEHVKDGHGYWWDLLHLFHKHKPKATYPWPFAPGYVLPPGASELYGICDPDAACGAMVVLLNEELKRLLLVDDPTAEQEARMRRIEEALSACDRYADRCIR